MAESNIGQYEYSEQDGQPIECYFFEHEGNAYLYTSHCVGVEVQIKNSTGLRTMYFDADYIQRDPIQPTGRGEAATLTVSVKKDNPVAKLFMGPPPERPVTLRVFRLHDQDHRKYDTVFYGRVGQAEFEETSECKLTVKMESWLAKELPNIQRQYFCENMVFDEGCRLKKDDYKVNAFIDRVEHNIYVYSAAFAEKPDGYFTGGTMQNGADIRMIREHKGNQIILQYPFLIPPRNYVEVLPGCDFLFKTCALRYKNTLNFSGCPYVPPIDPEKKEVGKGVYWVDSLVVKRDTKGFIGTISGV